MAAKSVAKIFFSSSRQLVKCSFNFRVFPRRVNLIPSNYSVRLLCGKWPSPATQLSCQSKHRFTSFFGIPLASALLSLVFGPTAFCGENDENEFSTPGKQPFFRSRTAKAAKRRARSEVARAESYKRRFFSEEDDENDPPPPVIGPPILRKRETQTQQLVRINNII